MIPFKVEIEDLRQSDKWAEYLESIGWKPHKLKDSVWIHTIKSGLGVISKVQRPYNMSFEDFGYVDEYCLSQKTMFVKHEPSLYQNLDLFGSCGYLTSNFPLIPPSTIYINLANSEDVIWKEISHSGKYSINRARREYAKTEFHQNPSEGELKKFHLLATETGRKKNFYVQTLEDLCSKAKIFGDNCHLIFVYDKNGVLASGKFYVTHKKAVWYLHGGTSEKGRKNKAGYELMWQSLLYFKKLGLEILDFEGVLDPRFPMYTRGWEGLTHFKEKFGGILARFPYPEVKLYNPVLKTLSKFTGMKL